MVVYNFNRLVRLVEGLSQEEIDYKGQNNELNSIAQLLRHLLVVDLHWVFRLQSKEVPQKMFEKFGHMYNKEGKLPEIKFISFRTLIDQYERVQDMLREVCLGITDDDLNSTVPFENGNSATIRWGIWHVADHSRHHYANIAYLKKLK